VSQEQKYVLCSIILTPKMIDFCFAPLVKTMFDMIVADLSSGLQI
jgi:hypothetical protein